MKVPGILCHRWRASLKGDKLCHAEVTLIPNVSVSYSFGGPKTQQQKVVCVIHYNTR